METLGETTTSHRARDWTRVLLVLAGLVISPALSANNPDFPDPVEDQILSLVKQVDDIRPLAQGSFEVAFRLLFKNKGQASVKDVQLEDHLEEQLPEGTFLGIRDLRLQGSLKLAGDFDGKHRTQLLQPGQKLKPGQSAEITFVVMLDPGEQTGPFLNGAEIRGLTPTGNVVRQCSSPEPETPECRATPFTVPTPDEITKPKLALAKAATLATLEADGSFRSVFSFTFVNLGTGEASNVNILDDLRVAFASAAAFEVEKGSLTAEDLTPNPDFDGETDLRVLKGSDSLLPGASGSVSFAVRFRINLGTGPLENSATGTAANSPPVRSSPGMDPDPDDDDDPARPAPTKVDYPSVVAGLAMQAEAGVFGEDRRFATKLTLLLRNYGETDLPELGVTNRLADAFADTPFSVESVSSQTLEVNPDFDGRDNAQLLATGNTLAIGASASLNIQLSFEPADTEGVFYTSARITSSSGASDRSTNGNDPDPDADGNPNEGVPTPIKYYRPADSPQIGLAKAITEQVSTETGFEVTFLLTLENLGNVPLDQVQVSDDLEAFFPAPATVSVVRGPVVAGGLSEGNDGFGVDDSNLLSGLQTLAVNASATITFTLSVVPDADAEAFSNQAEASGVAPDDGIVRDLSTSGVNPDPDDDGDPGGPGEDEPTPIPELDPPPGVGEVRGLVFLDSNHNRQFDDSTERTLAFWSLELLNEQGEVIGLLETAADGGYQFPALTPGDYFIQARHPDTRVVWIRELAEVPENGVLIIDVPFDPQGIVFDSETRDPLAEVTLALVDASGAPLPTACLLPDQQFQPVGSDGAYRFTLLHGASASCPNSPASYTLRIDTVPRGYLAAVSRDLPPVSGSYDTLNCQPPCLVQDQNEPPVADELTTYYLSFRAGPGGQILINNHLPIDPRGRLPDEVPESFVTLDVEPDRRRVTVGSVVGYTIELRSTAALPIDNLRVTDQPPPGFQFQPNTALLVRAGADGVLGTGDDVRTPIGSSGTNPVSFDPFNLGPEESTRIIYGSRVSTGVQPGIQKNTATANLQFSGTPRSIDDSAVVEVISDPAFDRATVLGKVFIDVNGDGVQNKPAPGQSEQKLLEPGLPGIRLITPEGLIVETDQNGRYHIADIEVRQVYGANYVIKLDATTLPGGYISRSDPRQIVRLQPGGIAKVNYAIDPGDPEEHTVQDCCGSVAEQLTLDPYRPEKTLDVALLSVTFLQDNDAESETKKAESGFWNLRFGVASNYYTQVPDHQLLIYDPADVGLTNPLAGICYAMLSPQQIVTVVVPESKVGDLQRLIYVLRVRQMNSHDPKRTCGDSACTEIECNSVIAADDRGAFDQTKAQLIQLPERSTQSASNLSLSAMQPGRSILEQNNIALSSAAREIWVRSRDGLRLQPAQRLITADQIEELAPWEVNVTQKREQTTLPSGINLEAKVLEGAGINVGAGSSAESAFVVTPFSRDRMINNGLTLLNPVASMTPPFFGAQDLRTTMKCCDTVTAVETVPDRDNNIVSVRITNSGAEPLTAQLSCDSPLCPWPVANRIPLGAANTTEVFSGDFSQLGPRAENWRRLKIVIERVCTDDCEPLIEYEVVRERIEETGYLRPPRTTARCMDVTAVPQTTERKKVAAIRLHQEQDPVVINEDQITAVNFGVAVLDLTVGGYSASGELEALANRNGLDESSYVDGRIAAYWRGKRPRGKDGELRWTVQVDSTKDELSDLLDNLKRKDPQRLFRQLDSDHYYPTYGDDSTTLLDTNTQGAFYARVETERSEAMWGNYVTGFTGTEYAQYNRSLYGAYGDYQSPELTDFGDSEIQLKLFGSEAQTGFAQASFLATGGTLYYLQHTDIVMGSEKVWIEVRRRDTEQLEEREVLLPGRDYEVDPLQGRILLRRPLSQVMRELNNNVVRSRPLEGDDVLLFVDYEYLPEAFDNDSYVYGARGRTWIEDELSIGGTHITDEQGASDYTLNGVDLVWRHSADTYLSAEFARSDNALSGSRAYSLNGGLTFDNRLLDDSIDDTGGDALGFEAQLNLADVGVLGVEDGLVRSWWKQRDEGFSSGLFNLGPKVTDIGLDFDLALNERWQLSGGASELEFQDVHRTRVGRVQVSGQWWCENATPGIQKGCTELDLETRYEDVQDINENPGIRHHVLPVGEALLVGSRLSRWVGDNRTVYVTGQTAIDSDSRYQDNDLLAIGTNSRISEALSVSLEASDGDRGRALVVGADYRLGSRAGFNVASGVGAGAISQFATRYTLTEGHELFGTYSIDPDRTDGARNLLTLGQRRDMGNRLRLFSESQFGRDNREASSGHVFGADFERNQEWVVSTTLQFSDVDREEDSFDRTAVSLGATFQDDDSRFSSRVEMRHDDSSAPGSQVDVHQYVTSTALRQSVGEDGRFTGKVNLAWTDDDYADNDAGRFAEVALGYAHRPIADDQLNWLIRYAYLYDVGTEGQSDAPGDEKAHFLSTEGLYDVNPEIQFGGKLAFRDGKTRVEKGQGDWLDTRLGLVIVRGTYKVALPEAADGLLPDHLELLAEYRWLRDFEGDTTQRGALVGIYRDFDPRHKPAQEPPDGKKRLVPPSVRFGIGYNFSGFDDDMRNENYKSDGWFVDMTTVF